MKIYAIINGMTSDISFSIERNARSHSVNKSASIQQSNSLAVLYLQALIDGYKYNFTLLTDVLCTLLGTEVQTAPQKSLQPDFTLLYICFISVTSQITLENVIDIVQ